MSKCTTCRGVGPAYHGDQLTENYGSHLFTAPASTSSVTHVLFVATPLNWEYMCTVCGHYLQIHYSLLHQCSSVYFN